MLVIRDYSLQASPPCDVRFLPFVLQLFVVGGNQRGRQFFKQHGWDDIGSDKIEGKVRGLLGTEMGLLGVGLLF